MIHSPRFGVSRAAVGGIGEYVAKAAGLFAVSAPFNPALAQGLDSVNLGPTGAMALVTVSTVAVVGSLWVGRSARHEERERVDKLGQRLEANEGKLQEVEGVIRALRYSADTFANTRYKLEVGQQGLQGQLSAVSAKAEHLEKENKKLRAQLRASQQSEALDQPEKTAPPEIDRSASQDAEAKKRALGGATSLRGNSRNILQAFLAGENSGRLFLPSPADSPASKAAELSAVLREIKSLLPEEATNFEKWVLFESDRVIGWQTDNGVRIFVSLTKGVFLEAARS